MIHPAREDTICAIATPPGTGAIAIIRMSGNESLRICEQVFTPRNRRLKVSESPSHMVHFGNIVWGEEMIDEVLVSVFRQPHSYTGENAVEISCHGSVYIQQKIMELLISNGARTATPGEFTLRAFLNGKFDLSQAEAVADLIAASSRTAHDLALDQMRGGFSKKIGELRTRLLDFASLIELELDFSQEDVVFADRKELVKLLEEIKSEIMHLASSFSYGNVLKTGIPVAITGKPNVGKSTLLNAILNEERAIVSDIPGTTRDTIEDTIVVQNYAFRFIDTAGLRHSRDAIESEGIERTYEKIRQAKIVLYVFDVRDADGARFLNQFRVPGSGFQDVEEDLRLQTPDDKKFILIGNKSDLLEETPAHLKELLEEHCIFISAKRKENINLILERLVEEVREMHVQDTAVVSNVRHYEALLGAQKSAEAVLAGLSAGLPGDLISVDLRMALYHLGEITGQITTDDILGNIFGRFCIGK
ncbi:MAG TPA: tRNA uridine-5-carboxymethylaminomethyl(34) synthesis GTPase MnmE [Bacteroidales bacterium]|nr:tRNA uridine-5-carboxymethylaminomethyl(34) synthesis GTPase MnmE [Bacteroidales bacterium]